MIRISEIRDADVMGSVTRREFIRSGAGALLLGRGVLQRVAKYDLLIKGGRVLDPSRQIDRPLDVAIQAGRIADLRPEIAAADAAEVVDARGRYVSPGLIDLHVHTGDMPPAHCLSTGVTAMVDAGSRGADNVAELVAMAKAAPGRLSYGTPGNGNPNHVAGELFKSAAGIDLVHVPYKGAAFVITDVIAGHVPVGFVTLGAAMPHLRSGKLKALGVTTNARWAPAPDLPTMADAGLPQVHLVDWSGFFVSARTPRPAVDRLSEAVQRSLAAPELRARLREQGLEVQGSSSADLAAEMQSDLARLGAIVKQAGIRAD